MARKNLLLFGIIALFLMQPGAHAQDWWNYNWMNRKAINVSVSAGATPEYYQIFLNVSYDPDMQADFDDLRFIYNEVTELDYWIESEADSSYAEIWIEAKDNITTADQTIYMYYGNPDVSTTKNGYATFDFFDDFPGTSLDGSKWNTFNSPTITVSDSIIGIKTTSINTLFRGIWSVNSFGAYNYSFRGKVLYNRSYTSIFGASNTVAPGADDALFYVTEFDTSYYQSRNEGGNTYTTEAMGADEFYIDDVRWKSNNTKFYRNGTLKANHSTNIPDEALKAYLGVTAGYANDMYADWILVKKYHDPEPTTTLGSEETWDVYAPLINVYFPQNEHINNSATMDFVFSATNNGSATLDCELFIDGAPYGRNSSVVNDTVTTIQNNVSLSEGTHSWYINCSDPYNNSDATAARTLFTDNSPPLVSLNSPAHGSEIYDLTPSLKFTSSDNFFSTTSCEAFIGSEGVGTATAGNNTETSITSNLTLEYGNTYQWFVNCTDGLGYTGKSATWEFSVYEVRVERIFPLTITTFLLGVVFFYLVVAQIIKLYNSPDPEEIMSSLLFALFVVVFIGILYSI